MPKTLDSHFSIMSTNRALQPPLPAALRPYEDVMKLLAAFSGPNCEVVLHDLSDPVHSVVRVENGEVTGRAVGQGLRHLVPNLLRMPRTDDGGLSSESPNLLPVYWLRSRGRLIRALSLLIRDDAGEVVGVLCINQDVTNVSAAAGQLQALLALLPPGEASILPEASASADALASEHAAAQLASAVSRNTEAKDLQKDSDIELEGSVLKTVYAMIDRMTERVRAGRSSSAVLTREERLPLVRFMDTRGVFLVKGALDYAAERLGVSKVTLYSDLDLLRRESESAGSLASGRQKSEEHAKTVNNPSPPETAGSKQYEIHRSRIQGEQPRPLQHGSGFKRHALRFRAALYGPGYARGLHGRHSGACCAGAPKSRPSA